MIIVNARSPYFIEATGSTNTSVQLFLWNTGSAPASPNYTFTKTAPSATQTTSYYNIAPYLEEFIENLDEDFVEAYPDKEITTSFVQFRAVAYSNGVNKSTAFQTRVTADSGTLESFNCLGNYMGDYVTGIAVDGFNSYMDGYNKINDVDILGLFNSNIPQSFAENSDNTSKAYFNIIVNKTSNFPLQLGRIDSAIGFIPYANYPYALIDSSTGIFNIRIAYHLIYGETYYIKYRGKLLFAMNVEQVCEPKYTPVVCKFINRYGGYYFITFYKAKFESITTNSETTKLLSDSPNYSTKKGQVINYNINGQKSIRLNTGWVDESYSEMIEDLMLSKTIYLDGKPALIKTNSMDMKTNLQDKNINYTIEFDYAFLEINNVI